MNKFLIFALTAAIYLSQSQAQFTGSCNQVQFLNPAINDQVVHNKTYQRLTLSGYLNVNADPTNNPNGNSSLYYIFYSKITTANYTNFPSQSLSDIYNTPLIIWLNGGPGSSSQLGNFFENGPYYLLYNQTTGSLIEDYRNPGSWADNFNVIYFDQPIGTGLSYLNSSSDMAVNIQQVASQFFNALTQLVSTTNSPFKDNNNLCSIFKNFTQVYITGESYGGKYVPAIAAKIMTTLDSNNNTLIPLKGISIGDGWTSPIDILSELGSFAYNLGLIDFQERIQIENILLASTKAYNAGLSVSAWNGYWNAIGSIQQSGGGIWDMDIFNFTDNNGNPQVPGLNFSLLDSFFNIDQVKIGYNILVSYTDANEVEQTMIADCMNSATSMVEMLLNNMTAGNNKQPFKVMIYNGQDDLVVNNMGTMKWVDKLNWNGQNANNFKNLDLNPWLDSNKNVVGYLKCADNLNFKIVNKAGHLVPFYQPQNSVNMITDFINNSPSNWQYC